MYGRQKEVLKNTIEILKRDGLYKTERVLTTPQSGSIEVAGGKKVINFCANNYLGLADNPETVSYTHLTLPTN